jgi:hypothetical protein
MEEQMIDKTGYCKACPFIGACVKCLQTDDTAWVQRNNVPQTLKHLLPGHPRLDTFQIKN